MGDALVGAVSVDWLIHTVHREVRAITTSMFSQNSSYTHQQKHRSGAIKQPNNSNSKLAVLVCVWHRLLGGCCDGARRWEIIRCS